MSMDIWVRDAANNQGILTANPDNMVTIEWRKGIMRGMSANYSALSVVAAGIREIPNPDKVRVL